MRRRGRAARRAGGPDPRQPDRATPVARTAHHRAGPGRRPAADRPAARRRPARPPDRVVVLHRPPARHGRDGTTAARLRVRHLPGRARAPSRRRGPRTWPSPTRPATPSTTTSAWRSGRRSTARHAAPTGAPIGFDLSLSGLDPTDPSTLGRHALDDGRHRRHGPPRRGARTGRGRRLPGCRAVSAWTCACAPTKPPALPRHATAGSTSGRPAARTTTPGRRWTPPASVAPRRRAAGRHRDGLVRPPVGRLHQRRRRRLGLVRGQPRRRHGPDAVPRPRRRRLATRSSTGRSSTPTARPATSTRDALHGRGHRSTGRARRPAPTTRRAGGSPSRARRLVIDLEPDRRRPGAGHPGHDRASSTGRARRSSARPATASPLGGEALRGADRLRPGGARGEPSLRRQRAAGIARRDDHERQARSASAASARAPGRAATSPASTASIAPAAS